MWSLSAVAVLAAVVVRMARLELDRNLIPFHVPEVAAVDAMDSQELMAETEDPVEAVADHSVRVSEQLEAQAFPVKEARVAAATLALTQEASSAAVAVVVQAQSVAMQVAAAQPKTQLQAATERRIQSAASASPTEAAVVAVVMELVVTQRVVQAAAVQVAMMPE
jgi:hypothetical protein